MDILKPYQDSNLMGWIPYGAYLDAKSEPRKNLWTYKAESEIKGFLFGQYLARSDTYRVKQIAKRKQYNEKGVGRKLLSLAYKKATKRQAGLIKLDVKRNNSKALDFYSKFGFTKNTDKDDKVEMILRLGFFDNKKR